MSEQEQNLSAARGPTNSLMRDILEDDGWLSYDHPWVRVLILMNKLNIKIRTPHEKIRTALRTAAS